MHLHKSRRIVVTGIGLCTPLGSDRESSWRRIIAGESGIRWLSSPHCLDSPPLSGGSVCFPSDRPYRHTEPLIELALTTAAECLVDSGLNLKDLDQQSVGVVFGTSKGGLHTFSRMFQDHQNSPPASQLAASNDWLDVFPNRAALAISSLFGSTGPVLCPIAACATGLAACLRGAELIQNGDCDIVFAGSADTSLQPVLLSSFRRLGVLSKESENPAVACRPFDANRSGFVIGEGAACLALECLDSAIERGATCYAEWVGGRMLSDPHGITQVDPEGTSLRRLLADLGSLGSPIPDYINLHGTGTVSNDLVESQAIRCVFGNRTDGFDCSSLKGGLGHLLGAAGSVELAATILAIRDQIVPPTANLTNPDPQCQLNLTPIQLKHRRIDHAWKLSLGFGGHLAGACLRRMGTEKEHDSNHSRKQACNR